MVNMLKVVIAVFVLLVIVGIGMLGKKLKHSYIFRSAKINNEESFWIEFCAGILVLVVAISDYLNNRPSFNPLMVLGLLIFFAGGLLQFIARKHLFEDLTFEHRLSSGFEAAQTKIYAYLRYPGSSALILLLFGLSLSLGSLWGVIVTLVLFVPSVIFQISQEERALHDKFGDRWLRYTSKSKRIIPNVW